MTHGSLSAFFKFKNRVDDAHKNMLNIPLDHAFQYLP